MVPDERLRHVAQLFADGAENLDILNDAIVHDEDLEPLIWLLDRIDINAIRVQLIGDHVRTLLAAAFWQGNGPVAEDSPAAGDSPVDGNGASDPKYADDAGEKLSSDVDQSRQGGCDEASNSEARPPYNYV